MDQGYDYYYNNVPGVGPCRNNLIYTSLISLDKKTFVQWYHNDTEYHKGMNEVVDPALMEAKWDREICYLHNMSQHYPTLVPKIKQIDILEKKIYTKPLLISSSAKDASEKQGNKFKTRHIYPYNS